LRGPIGRTVGLQHAPELRFQRDVSIDMRDKLAEILREDEAKARAAGREPDAPAVPEKKS
jgi:ribosome-binding factor A